MSIFKQMSNRFFCDVWDRQQSIHMFVEIISQRFITILFQYYLND